MASRPRTRLAPDARRGEILEHARRLFGARSYAAVSASEIARASGVTPALVSHYFPGGKREIFLVLLAQLGGQVAETIHADPSLPVRQRVTVAIESWLAWLEANSQTWLATAAQGEYIADPELQALFDSAREQIIDAIIADYTDTLADDSSSRMALRSWFGFNRAASRSWLKGEATRAQTALLLTETLHHLVTAVAPALNTLTNSSNAVTTADAKTRTVRNARRRAIRTTPR